MKKTLRPYQRLALDALHEAQARENSRYLIVLPTGTGKSFCIANYITELKERYPFIRVLILHPSKELIEQNYLELLEHDPYIEAGIYSAGLKKKELEKPILFAGIQSIYNKVHLLDPAPHVVIVDEAHRISRKADTMYQKCIDTLKLMRPNLWKVGLTASPYRLNSGYLHEGEDKIFDSIVYDYPIQRAIDEGFLSPITAKPGCKTIDVSKVHKRGGEFIEKELQEVSCKITSEAIKDIVEKGADRKKWMIFATGIDHTKQIQEELKLYGIESGVVTGQTTDRDEIIDKFKNGDLRCIININVLLTGFNVPAIDLVVWLRPTNSPVLWVQGCGRGTRLHPDKKDCLVLDYSGNGVRLGPIDAVQVRDQRGKGDGIPPGKICPECDNIISAGCRTCPYCGFEFPPPQKEIYNKHQESAILKDQIEPEWFNVDSVSLHLHQKSGKADSVRIEYVCGLITHREWIFPESATPGGMYYFTKFCKDIGVDPIYNSAEFVESVKLEIDRIAIKPDGKYIKIVEREKPIKFIYEEKKDLLPLF